jgi:precorrin-3B synthase
MTASGRQRTENGGRSSKAGFRRRTTEDGGQSSKAAPVPFQNEELTCNREHLSSVVRPLSSGPRHACPGLSAPMPTGDGLLVRFLPAGSIAVDAFIAFCAAARRHGNGTIEISARGSLQVRGLAAHTAPSFAAAVAALGIAAADGVPVIASPLDDPDTLIDADALAAELRLAVAGAGLALAPKVSVVVDGGGRAHLDAVPADIRLRAVGPPQAPLLCVGIAGDGASATWLGTVELGEASAAVVALLRAVEAVGPDGRAADLLHAAEGGNRPGSSVIGGAPGSRDPDRGSPDRSVPGRPDAPKGPQSHVHDALPGNTDLPDRPAVRKVAAPPPDVEPHHVRLSMVRPLSGSLPLRPLAEMIGLHLLRDGKVALGVALAFGHADSEALAQLTRVAAAHGATAVRPTAGRTLLLLGVAENGAAALADAAEGLGFITRPDDPRRRIAACPGAPACASGLIPARAMAAALAVMLAPDNALSAPSVDWFGPQPAAGEIAIHLSGCRKGCAHPAPAAVTVVGTERGCGIVRGGSARGAPQRFVAPANLAGEIARIAASLREAAHG